MSRWIVLLTLLFTVFGYQSAAAESRSDGDTPAEAENRYQIDMLIFSRRDAAMESSELWRNELDLKYPSELIRLELNYGEAVSDRILDIPSFQLQAGGDEELLAAAKRLRDSRRHRTLFQGSWIQPLQPTTTAPSLLIRGGDAFGDHFELEGSVKLSLDRYLHINAQLWLSKFAPASSMNFFSEWPSLPIPFDDAKDGGGFDVVPFSPVLPPRDPFGDKGRVWRISAVWLPGRAPEDLLNGVGFGARDFEQRAAMNVAYDRLTGRNRSVQARGTLSRLQQATAEQSGGGPEFLVERTVVMKQHRRMRSSELHYLDHPLFGLLVKITPVAADDGEPSNTDA